MGIQIGYKKFDLLGLFQKLHIEYWHLMKLVISEHWLTYVWKLQMVFWPRHYSWLLQILMHKLHFFIFWSPRYSSSIGKIVPPLSIKTHTLLLKNLKISVQLHSARNPFIVHQNTWYSKKDTLGINSSTRFALSQCLLMTHFVANVLWLVETVP